MKAVYIQRHGDPSVLESGEMPEPSPAPDEVVVSVRAVYAEQARPVHARRHSWDENPRRTDAAHILGGDCAGEIAAVGADAAGFSVGQRVVINPLVTTDPYPLMIGTHRHGSYAELVAVPAANVVALPESVSFELAASLPTVFLPTWSIIVREAKLQPHETALVLSASSGVGAAAIQIIKGVVGGACIAATSTGEKIQKAYELGADYAINYRTEDLAQRVKDLTAGRGVDLVVDSTGALLFEAAYSSLARGGRYGTCGVTSGYQSQIHLGPAIQQGTACVWRVSWAPPPSSGRSCRPRPEASCPERFTGPRRCPMRPSSTRRWNARSTSASSS